VLKINLSHNENENEKHQKQAFRPVPPKKIFVVKQASYLLLKKLVENATKYQIKHSYSIFLMTTDN